MGIVAVMWRIDGESIELISSARAQTGGARNERHGDEGHDDGDDADGGDEDNGERKGRGQGKGKGGGQGKGKGGGEDDDAL